jgi:hypothetical protein
LPYPNEGRRNDAAAPENSAALGDLNSALTTVSNLDKDVVRDKDWYLRYGDAFNAPVIKQPTWTQVRDAVLSLYDADGTSCMSLFTGNTRLLIGGGENNQLILRYWPDTRERDALTLVNSGEPISGSWSKLTVCGQDSEFHKATIVTKEIAVEVVQFFFDTTTMSDQFTWIKLRDLPRLNFEDVASGE